MRLRKTLLTTALTAVALGGILAGTASASSPPICTTVGGSSVCLNRSGGGTGNGTPIIGWHNDGDANNDFVYAEVRSECGMGTVTALCPFNSGTINNRYIGDTIYELGAANVNGKCVGIAADWGDAVLEGCGADGYLFVRSSTGFMVNVGATNHYGAIRWMDASGPAGDGIILDSPTGDQVWTGP